jgi:hypothetical protein
MVVEWCSVHGAECVTVGGDKARGHVKTRRARKARLEVCTDDPVDL